MYPNSESLNLSIYPGIIAETWKKRWAGDIQGREGHIEHIYVLWKLEIGKPGRAGWWSDF